MSLPILRDYSTQNRDKLLQVKVPHMGDSITEATVVEWVKNPGDLVEEDEVIVVLETDKVSVDVRSPCPGKILKQLAKVNDTVKVDLPLVELAKGEEQQTMQGSNKETKGLAEEIKSSCDEKTPGTKPKPTGNILTISVPQMGESITEGTVAEIKAQIGSIVRVEDVILVLETDKVSVEVKAEHQGIIRELHVDVGDLVKVRGVLAKLEEVEGELPSTSSEKKTEITAEGSKEQHEKQNEKLSSSSSKAPTRGEEARITDTKTVTDSTESSTERTYHRTKMNRMRLRIAERLKESQNIAASLTTFQECDMSNLINLRKKYKDSFETKHGVKLGFMSAFVKATAAALQQVPVLNAMIDEATSEIVYHDYVDMSVAVSTPKGLVTPIIKNCESLGFADIEKALTILAERARKGELTMEDLTGGTFTISNGGVFGSLLGTPILNRPQSGILGMHATKDRPVAQGNEIIIRPMMYLALTYDHRLIDGREAVVFLKSIAGKIEDPERLILDL